MLKEELRTVLITGATGGLGHALALECARQNKNLIILGRNEEKLAQLQQEVQTIGCQDCQTYAVDLTNASRLKVVLSQILERNNSVDVLINNAGFGLFADFMDIDLDLALKMFEVNVLAMMSITQVLAKPMIKAHNGQIINIASMAGKVATPKSTIYSATKFAVIGFSNALRLELARYGVYVTTVNPGPIKTKFFDTADPTGKYLEKISTFALDPDYVAQRIVNVIGTKRREINLPRSMAVGVYLAQLFPSLADVFLQSFGDLK